MTDVRPWIVAMGLVLLTAGGIGLVTAATSAPACLTRPGGIFGAGDGGCATARTDALAGAALAVSGVFVAVLGAALPVKAPVAVGDACPACGRRLAAPHGFCPGCGASR